MYGSCTSREKEMSHKTPSRKGRVVAQFQGEVSVPENARRPQECEVCLNGYNSLDICTLYCTALKEWEKDMPPVLQSFPVDAEHLQSPIRLAYESLGSRRSREMFENEKIFRILADTNTSNRDKHRAVIEYLDAGGDVNASSRVQYSTPLLALAVFAGVGMSTLQTLLEHEDLDIDATNAFGQTALEIAIYKGDFDLVLALVEAGADVNVPGQFGRTMLMTAVTGGYHDIVYYLSKIVNVNAYNTLGSALSVAINHDDENTRRAMVSILVNAGADINTKEATGVTFLMQAAERGDAGLVTLLLERGADPYALDPFGFDVLTYAGRNNDVRSSLIPWMDARKRVSREVGAQKRLELGIMTHNSDMIHDALGAWTGDINRPISKDEKLSPLMLSIYYAAPLPIIERLLERGADPNISYSSEHNTTALMYTVYWHGSKGDSHFHPYALRVAELLYSQGGANINASTTLGDTALSIAESYGFSAMENYLKDKGATPTQTSTLPEHQESWWEAWWPF